MKIVNTLIEFLKNSPVYSVEKAPEGFCPNCWGRQEYGQKFYEVAKNYNVDINTANPNVGWVQDYANKHLSGILLKNKNDGLVCEQCNLTYREE